jgi:hypothetical protein
VVAAQAAVDLVEHLVRAAVRAVAFPVAVLAVQHGRVAAPVQEQQALLAARHALGDFGHERRREHGAARLLAHVHAPYARQSGRT